MDTGKAILIGGAIVGGVLLVRAFQQSAQQLPPGANTGAAASVSGLAHASGGDSLDKLAHDGASVALQSQGVPKPVADFAANYNFYANAKRVWNSGVIQGAGSATWNAAKGTASSAWSGAKSVASTLTFGLL
jgi:hypothetical protein